MATSDNLDILMPTDTQTQKMAAVSQALVQIERAVSDKMTLDVSAAVDNATNDFVLDYDDTDDLSSREALRMFYLEITGSPSFEADITHPQKKHLFFVRNSTTQDAVFRTIAGEGPTVGPGLGQLIYCDGTDVEAIFSDARTQLIPIDVSFWGKPSSSEVLGRMICAYDLTVAGNTTDIQVKLGANPTSAYTIDVYEDGSKRGEIDITTGGAVSYDTWGTTAPITFNAGNEIIFYAPATVDATIEDIRISLGSTSEISV